MAGNLYDDAIEALDDQQAPQQQGPEADPFEDAVRRMRANADTRLRASIQQKDDTTPERAAEAQKLAQETGLPLRLVESNFDRVKKEALQGRTPYERMFAETPALAEWASVSENAQVAADDLEQLGAIEWLLTAPGRAFARGVNQVRAGRLATESIWRELTQQERDLLNSYEYGMEEGGALGAGDSWFRKAVTGSAQQLPNLFGAGLYAAEYGVVGAAGAGVVGAGVGAVAGGVGAVPGALAAAPYGARAGALYGGAKFGFELEAGLAYREYQAFRDEQGQPLDPTVAKMAAIATGSLNAGLEAFGLEKLAATVPGLDKLTAVGTRAAVKQALRQPSVRAALLEAATTYGKTLGIETATEVAQRAVTIMSGELAKFASGQNIPTKDVGTIAEDLANEGIGALQSFAFTVAAGPAMGAARVQQQIRQGEQSAAFFKALGGQAAASKTIERMPEAARAFIEQATKDGPIGTIYAPAETWVNYWQSQGVDPAAIAADVTGRPDALEHSLTTGEDLAIPTSRYATTLAATSHNAFFTEELRLAPGEMNGREAKAYRAQLEAEAKAEQQQQIEAAAPTVREDVLQQLQAAGVPAETAAQYADLFESTIGTLAERSGVDAADLYRQYGLKIERPAVQQPQRREAAPATATPEGATAGKAPDAATSAPLPLEEPLSDGSDVPGLAALEAAAAGLEVEPVVVDGEQGLAENASGESSASLEAMSRLQGMRARGEQFGVYNRAGQFRPLIGADAVDYQPAKGETFGIQGPQGFQVLTDNGGRVVDTNQQAGQTQGGTDAEQGRGDRGARGEGPQGDAGAAGAPQGGGAARAVLEPYANVDRLGAYADALDAARSLDPNLDEALFRAEFDHRLDLYDDIQAAQQEADPRVLLKAIAKLGGIFEDPKQGGFVGELRALREGQAFGNIGGIAGVLAVKPRQLVNVKKKIDGKIEIRQERRGGLGIDIVLQDLQADGRFPWLESIDDLVSFLDDVQRHGLPDPVPAVPDTAGLKAIGIDFERDWWNDANRQEVDLLDVDTMERDILEPEGEADTSFDVSAFGQSLFDALEEPGDEVQLTKADTLDTGEQQPRLPGAVGNVREEERPTPKLSNIEDEFRLTSEVDNRKGFQTTLFQSAEPTDSEAFRAWFGDSIVRTLDGAPMVVYHGTDATFEKFDPRLPIYLTSLEDEARAWGESRLKEYERMVDGDPGEATVMPLYVRITNPVVVDEWDKFIAWDIRDVERLEAQGFDGAVFRTETDGRIEQMFIAFRPGQVKHAERNSGAFSQTDDNVLYQPAYHGSPHIFEKFSLHAIGSGEGNQSFGWGLYFASRREIAENYREKLSPSVVTFKALTPEENDSLGSELRDRMAAAIAKGQPMLAVDALAERKKLLNERSEEIHRDIAEAQRNGDAGVRIPEFRANLEILGNQSWAIDKLLAGGLEMTPAGGRLYEVEIPDADYLDWDRPASQQSPKVREALTALGITWEEFKPKTPKQWLRWTESKAFDFLWREDVGIRSALREGLELAKFAVESGDPSSFNRWQEQHQGYSPKGYAVDPLGSSLYEQLQGDAHREMRGRWQDSARVVSEKLAKLGVNGIRYLDGGSRRYGQGTFNFVVFDDRLVEVTTFYQSEQGVDDAAVQAFAADVKQRAGDDLTVFDLTLERSRPGVVRLESLAVRRGAARAGLGSKVMGELTRWADRNGLRLELSTAPKGYQPTKESTKTTSEDRLTKFYRQFGFIRNTGRNRDFTTRASMYREPTVFPTSPAAQAIERGPSREQLQAFRREENLQAWFGDSKVVDADGRPLVVYHGTTGDFTTFDAENANPESDMGAGFYFSSETADVGENYAGFGPDLEQKIQMRVEQLEGGYEYNDDVTARLDAIIATLGPGANVGEAAIIAAREDLKVANKGLTLPVLLKIENPAVLGGGREETRLTLEREYAELTDFDEDEVQELRDEGMSDDEIRMELSDRNGYEPTEKGTLPDFLENLRSIANRYDQGDVDGVIQRILEESYDGDIALSRVFEILTADEEFGYYSDDQGRLVSKEITRQALEATGFDGIIDYTVDEKFGSSSKLGKSMAGMHPGTVHYIAFKPTQIKGAIGNQGTFDPSNPDILFQGEEGRRGAIRFGRDRQFTIQLLEKADLSTFLHESGHFFLEVFGDLVDKVKATPEAGRSDQQRQLLADYDTLLEHLGAKDRASVGQREHEKFAEGFEAYLMEGRAPSLRLQAAFSRFRAWLVGIYRSLSRFGVTFTPEVRAVMDRLVATDNAIAQANDLRDVPAMFTTAADAGMTEREFSLYRDTIAAASRTAREQLEVKLLAEVQREQTKQWKARKAEIADEVTAEVHAEPVYQALAAIQRGTAPDGSPLVEGLETEPLKLSKAILVARYGADYLKRLPKPAVYSVDGGLDPNTVATMFGFTSGDEMLKALENAAPMREVIKARTEQRMLAEHGSILLDGTLASKAQAAIANEDRDAIIRAEMRALGQLRRTLAPAKKQAAEDLQAERAERDYERRWLEAEKKLEVAIARGEKDVEIEALRQEVINLRRKARGGAATINAAIPTHRVITDAAKARIAGMKIRAIRPDVFWNASRRAAQQAIERAARQDFDGAIEAKRKELLNLALYREAERVLEDVTARVKFAKDLGRPASRSSIGLAGHNYLDQIDGVLDRFEFAKVPQKVLDRRASLVKFLEGIESQGLPADMPEQLVDEALRRNYQDLTVEELVGVTDGLKQLVHLARLKNRLLKAAAQRELDATATEIADSIRANGSAKGATGLERDRRASGERSRLVAAFFASHRKIASFVREMDGFVDGGPMWEAVVRPLNEAGAREAEMNAQASAAFQALVDKAFPTANDKRDLYAKVSVPEVGRSMSKMERLMVALNWGNEGNRERIRKGERWDDGQVGAILATLSRTDFEFVQGVFDLVNGYWTDIAAKQERVYGVAPEKVEATPIRTAFGDFAGGYFPLKYDERLSPKAGAFVDVEDAGLARAAAYAQATTKRGHTKARVDGVKLPVRLDFGVMFEHVKQVIHDLSYHETLIDVGRVLAHPAVQRAIYDVHGDEVYRQLKNGIRDVAIGDIPATAAFDKAINHLRAGATVAGLGWNLTTALLQPLGLTQSMVRIGPKWVARGMSRWLRDAATMENTAAWVRERSTFMRERGRTMQREISEVRNTVGVDTGRLSGWVNDALQAVTAGTVTKQGMADSYFYLIQQAQLIADLPTWLGQYEKALEGGADEATAIAQADQAVLDSQGGGQVKDLAAVQRGGPLMRLWTNFYSFFNVTYNLTAEATRRTDFRKPGQVGRLMVDYLLLYTVPAFLGYAVREALRPNGDDDEDKNLAVELAREQASYLLGTMMITRELSGVVGGGYGYEGPAGARAIVSASRLLKQVEQGEPDAAFWRSLNDTAGAVFHYPAGQIKRTVEGFAALLEGRTSNPGALISGAPPK